MAMYISEILLFTGHKTGIMYRKKMLNIHGAKHVIN